MQLCYSTQWQSHNFHKYPESRDPSLLRTAAAAAAPPPPQAAAAAATSLDARALASTQGTTVLHYGPFSGMAHYGPVTAGRPDGSRRRRAKPGRTTDGRRPELKGSSLTYILLSLSPSLSLSFSLSVHSVVFRVCGCGPFVLFHASSLASYSVFLAITAGFGGGELSDGNFV